MKSEKHYIEELRKLIAAERGDPEVFHGNYDSLLTEIIEDFGFKKFFEVFDKEYNGPMWYA